jgi:hypothetical protein
MQTQFLLGDESRTEESPRWLGSTMYEITVNRKQARTPISLKSGPFPLKFSENLQGDSSVLDSSLVSGTHHFLQNNNKEYY